MVGGGFPGGTAVKNPPAKSGATGDVGSMSGSGRSLGERKWQPTPVFLPEKSHGQRSLAGHSPWSRKESDTIEWLGPHTNTNGYNAHEQNFLRFFNNHRVCKGIQRPQSLRMATLESRDSCVSVEPQLRRSEWLVEWFVIALFPNLSSVKATIHPTCEMNWLLKLEHLAQRQPINTWERKEGRRGREDGMERGRETGRKEGKEGDVSPSFFKNSNTVICPLKLLTFK